MKCKLASICLFILAWGAILSGQEVPDEHPDFERLKRLEGNWSLQGEEEGKVSYHVTAAGSAVVETLFPGEPHEMVTIYHLDGDKILLTHYCAMGNQPRMRQIDAAEEDDLVFEFAGGTGVEGVGHMHDLTITFVGDDALRHEWVAVDAEGNEVEHAVFDFERASE